MRVWKISELELRRLGESMAGRAEYPLSRPVELMVPQRTLKPPFDEKYGGDAFLFVTREGTAGVLRMTAQVTNADAVTGMASSMDFQYSPSGFYRGAKISFAALSEPEGGAR